jgi:hypothetical protein
MLSLINLKRNYIQVSPKLEAMRKGKFRCHARHLVVEAKVKARLSKMNSLFALEKRNKRLSIVLVHLNVHIITPINDCPLVSVLYPSDNTLQRIQINNLINTKIFVIVDAVP